MNLRLYVSGNLVMESKNFVDIMMAYDHYKSEGQTVEVWSKLRMGGQ